MANLFTLFISAVLINNVILSQFLGVCPFLGVSKNKSSAIGMGAAVTFVTGSYTQLDGYKRQILPKGNIFKTNPG